MKGTIEYTGRGLSTDIIEASILSYIAVANKIIHDARVYTVMQAYIKGRKSSVFETVS